MNCPENSLCAPYGPGFFECSCTDNYHGYKCLREVSSANCFVWTVLKHFEQKKNNNNKYVRCFTYKVFNYYYYCSPVYCCALNLIFKVVLFIFWCKGGVPSLASVRASGSVDSRDLFPVVVHPETKCQVTLRLKLQFTSPNAIVYWAGTDFFFFKGGILTKKKESGVTPGFF